MIPGVPSVYIYVALLLGLIGLCWYCHHQGYDSGYAIGRNEVIAVDAEAVAKQAEAQAKELDQQTQARHAAEEAYAKSQADLDAARAERPATVIRVCNGGSRHSDAVPAIPGAAGGTDATGPGKLKPAPESPAGTDFDTRPLYALTDEGDDCVNRLTELQKWVKAQSSH